MKISNKYIKIRSGNKNYTFKNLILNNYLKTFIDLQLENEPVSYHIFKKIMQDAFLKLDTPITKEITPDTVLTQDDFDIYIWETYKDQKGNSNSVETTWTYSLDRLYFPINEEGKIIWDLSDLIGRKICGIGFGVPTEIRAYVDISAYNIVIQEGEYLDITRVDQFESDAECIGTEMPYHLAPLGKTIYENGRFLRRMYPYLYSVGLGRQKGKMEEEYVIGRDINYIRDNDLTFSFDINNVRKTFVEKNPSIKVFPSSMKHPVAENYKYIIYKFKNGDSLGYDEEYTMNYEINEFGNFNIKTRLTRKEDE